MNSTEFTKTTYKPRVAFVTKFYSDNIKNLFALVMPAILQFALYRRKNTFGYTSSPYTVKLQELVVSRVVVVEDGRFNSAVTTNKDGQSTAGLC